MARVTPPVEFFRFEARGRVLGYFREAESVPKGVALLGWRWKRGQGGYAGQGTIVLTDALGRELRRWTCRSIAWGQAAPVVSGLRRSRDH